MTNHSSPQAVCARITRRLAESVGPHRYTMWFDRSVHFDYRQQDRRLEVTVPNRFIADWIDLHFKSALRDAITNEVGKDVALDVHVDHRRFSPREARRAATLGASVDARSETANASELSVAPARPGAPASKDTAGAEADSKPSTTRPRRHKPRRRLRHRFKDFVVGPSNELAFAAASRLAGDDGEAHGISPLFIHGGVGLGKTHLLQAACHEVLKRKPDARVLYTTAEQFTNAFVVAVKVNKVDQFRRKYRRLDLLAVDDVQFLANKQATQQEFLHSFDAIDMSGARVMLASDCHPKLIHNFSESLVSRCLSGMVVEIRTPDTATRLSIVRALAERRGISLREAVVAMIAGKCRGSVREIEGALTKLKALACLAPDDLGAQDEMDGATGESAAGGVSGGTSGGGGGKPIGHIIANRLFEQEESAHGEPRRTVRVDEIVDAVSDVLSVDRHRVLGRSRHRLVVMARSMVVHLARQMTPMSYPEIARALGRDSHSFAITAVQRIKDWIKDESPIELVGCREPVPMRDLIDRAKYTIRRA